MLTTGMILWFVNDGIQIAHDFMVKFICLRPEAEMEIHSLDPGLSVGFFADCLQLLGQAWASPTQTCKMWTHVCSSWLWNWKSKVGPFCSFSYDNASTQFLCNYSLLCHIPIQLLTTQIQFQNKRSWWVRKTSFSVSHHQYWMQVNSQTKLRHTASCHGDLGVSSVSDNTC